MITKNSFVPGRVYSVIYSSEVEMVGKRELPSLQVNDLSLATDNGKAVNPLHDKSVTVRRVSTVQAAGNKTWTNYLAKRNEVPTGKPTWWIVSADNSCICVGTSANTQGKEYLRGLPRGITQETYFVNGIDATPAQVATIRAFKKSQGESEFVMLSLSKLVNVGNEQGEAE